MDRTLQAHTTEQLATSTAMAGFVVWLAGQRVPPAQRGRVHDEVERFLSWQHRELPSEAADLRPAVWCYLLRRQHDGEGEAEVLKVWGALEVFLTYLDVSGGRA